MRRLWADHRGLLVGLVIVAIAARLFALWRLGDQLAHDPDDYLTIARSIVAGGGYGYPKGHINGSPSAYRPPLYPCLLAVVTAGSGGDAATIRRSIGAMQLLLGAGTVVLTVLAARRLGLGRASLVAGLLVAVDPLLVYDTSLVMTETTAAFLVALLLWLMQRASGTGGRFVTGIVFGSCCLCRPTFWAFGALLAIGWLFGAWRTRRMSLLDRSASAIGWWGPAASVVAGVAVAVAPWVARNAVAMGRPILTTTHGGYTLLLAHNPLYTQDVVDKPWGAVWNIDADSRWRDWLADRMQARNASVDLRTTSPAAEIARDDWMAREAWEYIREDPWRAVRSGLTTVGRFWNIVPMTTTNRSVAAPLRWTIGAYYAATLLAMLLGVTRLRRDNWSRWWPLLVLLLSFTVVHTLYWADMRMRAPLVPAIAFLTALGIAARPGGESEASHR